MTSCTFHQTEQWIENEEVKAFMERRIRTEEERQYIDKVKDNRDKSIKIK